MVAVYDMDSPSPAPLSYVERPPDPIDQPNPAIGKPYGTARRWLTFFLDPFYRDDGISQWHFGLRAKPMVSPLADPLAGYQAPFTLRMNVVRPDPITTSELWDASMHVPVPGQEGSILP